VTTGAGRAGYRLLDTAATQDAPIATISSFVVESGNPRTQAA